MSQNLSPRAGESPQRERKDSMKGEREDLVNHKEGRVLPSSLYALTQVEKPLIRK